MKKIFILTALFVLLGAGGLALADESTSTSSTAANKSVVYKPREVIVWGILTAISGKTLPTDLTIKLERVVPAKIKNFPSAYPQKDGSVVIHLTEKTKIVRRYYGKADLSELAVGDKIWVNGRMEADASVTAKLVKDNSIYKTFSASQGEVVSIDSINQTFVMKVVKKKTAQEYKVFVMPNTKFAKYGVEKPTLADLKVGDQIKVQGVIRQSVNEITADSVVIKVSDQEIKAFKLQKQQEAVKKQLEKKKEQLEKKVEAVKGKAVDKFKKQLEEINKKLENLATSTKK